MNAQSIFPTMTMKWYSEMGKKNIDLKIISIWRVKWETSMCVKRSLIYIYIYNISESVWVQDISNNDDL